MNINSIVRLTCLLGTGMALASLTGCASIVSGTNQVVSVETLVPAGKVAGANCKLQNDKGVYFVTTPGTVTVHRAYGDISVTCDKAGMAPTTTNFKSSTKGMLAGNILFGGVIGVGVDAATGAAYDYPALLQIMMTDSINDATATALPAPAVVGGAN